MRGYHGVWYYKGRVYPTFRDALRAAWPVNWAR